MGEKNMKKIYPLELTLFQNINNYLLTDNNFNNDNKYI